MSTRRARELYSKENNQKKKYIERVSFLNRCFRRYRNDKLSAFAYSSWIRSQAKGSEECCDGGKNSLISAIYNFIPSHPTFCLNNSKTRPDHSIQLSEEILSIPNGPFTVACNWIFEILFVQPFPYAPSAPLRSTAPHIRTAMVGKMQTINFTDDVTRAKKFDMETRKKNK